MAATVYETINLVVTAEPLPPRRLQPTVPRDLETICLKCLQKDPAKRYASAQALAEDLDRFLAGEPIHARPIGHWERTLKWARRRPLAAALALVISLSILLLVVAVLAIMQMRVLAAHASEQKARRAQELATLQSEAKENVLTGESAIAKENWQEARTELEKALAKIGSEPSLAELQKRAQNLLEEVKSRLAADEKRRQERANYDKFRELRDDALFHATLATGEGLVANLKATKKAGEKALALFGLTNGQGSLALAPVFTDSEKAEIIAYGYELLLILAEAEALGDQPQQALRLLDRAASLGYSGHPTQAYHWRRARYLERLGNTTDAKRERDQAVTRPPATALDYYFVGDEHYKQGNMLEAIRAFESALGQQPDHFWARYFLSVSYLRLQPPRPDLAKLGLTTCISQRPGLIWLYLVRGYAHTQLKEFQAAKEDFLKALQLAPNPDALHVLYANRGLLWFQQGSFEDAITDLQQAIALKPRDYQAYVTLALVYQEQKKWDLAKEQLDAAVDLEPDLALLYRLRAWLHLERQDQDLSAALRDYEKAIDVEKRVSVSPALAKDYAEKGRILHRSKKLEEAVTAYDLALKTDPSYAKVHLWRGQAQLQLKNYLEAAHSFDEYLEKGGTRVAAVYRGRGLARAQLNKYPEAIQDYTQALAMEPDHSSTYAARGRAYLAIEAYRLALFDFEKAIELNSASGDAYIGRGYAGVNLGQHRQAVGDAEAALKLVRKDSGLLYDAARICAQAVAKVQADTRQLNRQVLARDYQDRSVMLIRKSLELLPAEERKRFWRERVLQDAALFPIHGSTGFLGLATENSQWTK
jgi:tetratricopeptide (TPR) repeat protein